MKAKDLVVIGAGYAGVLAAVRAARRGRGRVRVRLLSDRPVFVERIRLHELAAHGRPVTRSLAGLLEGSGVELEVTKVRSLDPTRGSIETAAGPRGFDAAIVAVGSRTASAIPGAENAMGIDLGASTTLFEALRGRRDQHVLVVGGGLSGIELASDLAARSDVAVTLATSRQVGEGLSVTARREILRCLEALGVTVLEETPIVALERGRALCDRGALPFDHAVLSSGFRAAPLLADSGFEVDDSGRVPVDAFLRAAGHERVFVAGDAARVVTDRGPLAMGCKTAMPEGAHAADAAVAVLRGEVMHPFGWRDLGSCISLGRRRGIIQRTDSRGVTERVFRGRLAALLKELVCRYTVFSIHGERRGSLSYRWAS
jgi:NADH:ubiquinone reductase (H+-translocating)